MLNRLGQIESILALLLIISVIWVYFDAPKRGINRFVAILAIIFVFFPISFFMYILRTRILKKQH